MEKISLTLQNRTKWDVVFLYNKKEHSVIAGKSKTIKVRAGHHVYAIPPIDARDGRGNIRVEHDQTIFKLAKSATIECKLIGWQLDLTVRPNTVKR